MQLTSLVPAPLQVITQEGEFRLGAGVPVIAVGEALEVGGEFARQYGLAVRSGGDATPAVRLELDGDRDRHGDEGYVLEIRPEGIVIAAATRAGLVHGVQTLRQLASTSGVVPAGRVVDRPRYAYRGVMLDVARHFFAVPDVLRLIDIIALFKINYLHLHLTDDQGWRIAIEKWPLLTEFGGGTEVGDGPGGYYSRDDYRAIVAHAASRGITIVPEVDVPGHTNAALASYPVLSRIDNPQRYRGIEVGFSALDVGNPEVDRFLVEVFGELAALTPGPYVHFGGDEVTILTSQEFASIVTRAQDVVMQHGKTPIGWHDVTKVALRPSTVVQYWGVGHADGGIAAVAAEGTRVIMSPADRAYLDMKAAADSPYGLAWAGHVDTEAAYTWDPATYLPNVDESAILGVEAPLWTETVATPAALDFLLMPRLAVLAEIAWSSPDRPRDWADMRSRLATQAPLWESVGINFYRDPAVAWPE